MSWTDDLINWVLELPSSENGRVNETLVAVSVSRDMLISLADKAELFMERVDGRLMRFRREDVHKFKQYSPTRLFDPSTAQALVLRQLRHVTSHVESIAGGEAFEDSIFFLHDLDEGSGRASVKAWTRKFPPQPLGKLSSYLWSAPTEADARERMIDLDNLQSYLGSKIAFYVAFLTVLCSWQCLIAVPALAFTVLQFMYGTQLRLVLWNVVFVSMWSAAYTKSWANKSRELAAMWQGAEVEEADKNRPEFRGERRWVKAPVDPATNERGRDVLCELVKINSVKFALQPHYPAWRRRVKTLFSSLFILSTAGPGPSTQSHVLYNIINIRST